ncbi:MAG: hypothetical protein WDO19_31250 [Bacteroidota bacterium]
MPAYINGPIHLPKRNGHQKISSYLYLTDAGEKILHHALSGLNFETSNNTYLIPIPAQLNILRYYSINIIPKYLLFDKEGIACKNNYLKTKTIRILYFLCVNYITFFNFLVTLC